jgi:hypothetical protein
MKNNKSAIIIIVAGLAIAAGIFFLGGSKTNSDNANTTKTVNTNNGTSASGVENSVIKDGVQYITINAKGGYSPRVSTAKAGIPTKLIVKTNGTYDCSAALSIRSAGFQKVLANTGEETIDLGTPVAGTPVRGVCGMGMYNFTVNFQ